MYLVSVLFFIVGKPIEVIVRSLRLLPTGVRTFQMYSVT